MNTVMEYANILSSLPLFKNTKGTVLLQWLAEHVPTPVEVKNVKVVSYKGEEVETVTGASAGESKTEFYSFVRSLDALKISMQGNNKTVILSPDSPIAQIFYGE